jgi:hypothetical protein
VKRVLPALLQLLAILNTTMARRLAARPEDKETQYLRFLEIPSIYKDSSLSNLGKDLNNIYTGWVNASNALYPWFLTGSTYKNDLYGALGNRTGMIVVGVALLGGTGQSQYTQPWTNKINTDNTLDRLLLPQRD